MRRDFELVRGILLAIGNEGISDSGELAEHLSVTAEIIDYHLKLLAHDTNVLKGERNIGLHFGSPQTDPHWSSLQLTWAGNDLLDAMGDEKSWRKLQAALESGARVATIEAIKGVAKGVVAAGLGALLASVDDQPGDRSETYSQTGQGAHP